MSSIDLNIIERGIKGQAWSSEKGPVTAAELAKITEQRTNSSSALNALPTPFARFFVVKEAFRRVLEEEKNPKKVAGDAYRRLVSDTLDVFELLYNLNYHKKHWDESTKLIIREWNYDSDLKRLKKDMLVLGNAVANYFDKDLKALDKRIYFVVLRNQGRDYLLASSSPFTGFVTPSDLDKKMDRKDKDSSSFIGERYRELPDLTRKNDTGRYFRDIKLFRQRDKDFKNYMFHLVDNFQTGDKRNELRDYVKYINNDDPDITNEWEPQTESLKSENSNEVVINGLPIDTDTGISTINFFNNELIKLPFRLSRTFYRGMHIIGSDDDRDYDYLLPLSKEAISQMDDDFECECKDGAYDATVTLKYKGQTQTKRYKKDSPDADVRVVSLKDEDINFNLAVFPNILSPDNKENNYFKVMAVINDASESGRRVAVNKLDMTFFLKNGSNRFEEIGIVEKDNEHAEFGTRPGVVRSEQDEENEVFAGSKFYEIFNTRFDAVNLSFRMKDATWSGVLFPKWKTAQRTQDKYVYAVDLGTTNTYISSSKLGRETEPEQLCMDNPMVSYLHDFRRKSQYSLISSIEEPIQEECRKNIGHRVCSFSD